MKEKSAALPIALNNLNSTEQKILLYSFGIMGNEKMTNAQISKKLHISLSKIRSLRQTAIRKLKRDPLLSDYYEDNIKAFEKTYFNESEEDVIQGIRDLVEF